MLGCVYLVKNRDNGKSYIGKTMRGLARRRREHEASALREPKLYFNKALRKYGFCKFDWLVLYESDWEEELWTVEKELIKVLGTMVPNGYNLTNGGEGVTGLYRTEAHRRKLSIANTGKHPTTETRKKLSSSHKGKIPSAEARAKLSAYSKGRKMPLRSPERRAEVSKNHVGMSGQKHSLETRMKMSDAHKKAGRIPPSAKGKKRSLETKAKMSIAHKARCRRAALQKPISM